MRAKYKSDLILAKKLGVSRKFITLRGGAERIQAMSPGARKMLLDDQRYGNSRTVHKGGMRSRGMGYSPRQNRVEDTPYERLVQKMLRERGLIKE